MENKTKLELASCIIDAIKDGRLNDKPGCEIHNEVFNTDYFIIGRYQAEQWLIANGGVLNAMEVIKDYEQSQFGQITTDLSEAERVCNMFVYILGEELMAQLSIVQANWEQDFSEELLNELLLELEAL